jgi:hypothetical protein
MRLLLTAALIAPLLTGCLVYASESGETTTTTLASTHITAEPLEALREARFDGRRLTVRADSNGCTDSTHFEVSVVAGEPAAITLRRVAPDLCKALVPDGVVLSWTYDELELEAGGAARLVNPLKL